MRSKLLSIVLSIALAGFIYFVLIFHPVVQQNVSAGYFDFVAFYSAGQILKEGFGKKLYRYDLQKEFQRKFTSRPEPIPYNHPPFEALVFVPLAFLPYVAAYRIWVLVNLLLVVFSAYLLRDVLRNVQQLSLRFAFVLSSFIPVFATLLQGQDSLLMLLLYTAAFWSLKQDREARAGCFLALGLFKLQLIVPFVPVLFVRKRWKAAFSFVTTAGLLGLISLWLTGWGGLRDWLDLLQRQNDSLGSAVREGNRTILPTAMANLRGFSYAVLAGRLSSDYLDLVVVVCSVMLVTWGIFKWGDRYDAHARTFDLLFSLDLVVTLLVSYHLNLHDLVLISLPILMVFNYFETFQTSRSLRRFGFVVAALLLFFILVLLFEAGSRRYYLLAPVMFAFVLLISSEITDARTRETGWQD